MELTLFDSSYLNHGEIFIESIARYHNTVSLLSYCFPGFFFISTCFPSPSYSILFMASAVDVHNSANMKSGLEKQGCT